MKHILALEAENVMKWISGKDDGVERRGEDPVKGSTWYLLSVSWFRKWRLYVGLETANHAEYAIYYLPRIDNSDLLLSVSSPFIVSSDNSHFNTPVKSGLQRNVDYQLLPAKAWAVLDAHYGHEGQPLKRFTCELPSGNTTLEVEFIYVNLIFVPPIEQEANQVPSAMYCSRYETVEETKPRLISLLKQRFGCDYIQSEEVKVWKVRKDTTLADVALRLDEYIKDGLRMPGKVLDGDKRLKHQVSILVETVSVTGHWRLTADAEKAPILLRDPSTESSSSSIPVSDADKQPLSTTNSLAQTCPQCTTPITNKPYFCECRQVRLMQVQYCGYRCRCAHTHTCLKPTLQHTESSIEKRTPTGLTNTGNTCYFNAAFQCLAHTRFLTAYFLSDSYKSEINRNNRLGTCGRLTEVYANTLRALWLGCDSQIVPSALKEVIVSKCPQFRSFDQHDAQELLSSILDGLSEDLNRVQLRPYSEEIKVSEESTDEEKARMYWSEFESRTSSIIVDNMYGQYRSQIICPECGDVSVRFEPFLMLAVDIPSSTSGWPFDVTFIPIRPFATPISYQIFIEGTSTIADIKIEISQRSGKPLSNLIAVLTDTLRFVEVVSEATTICSLVAKANFNHRLCVYEADFDPKNELVVVDLVQGGAFGLSEHRPVSYSRLISVANNTTLEQLYLLIFALLLPLFELDPVTVTRWKHRSDPDVLTFAGYRETEGSELLDKFLTLFPTIASEKWCSTGPYNVYTKNYLSDVFDQKLQKYASCVYCKKQCKGCLLPFSTDTIGAYTQSKASGQVFQLVILFKDYPELFTLLNVRKEDILNDSILKVYQTQNDTPVSLFECLDFTCMEKVLDEYNSWFCKECRKHVRGGKKMSMHKVPKVLWIHLKRFKQGLFGAVKNERGVKFTEELDLRGYVDAVSSGSPRFRLYALCNHMGGMNGGHYTAYAKNSGNWFYFDDESVHSVPLQVALESTPYVLCYESID